MIQVEVKVDGLEELQRKLKDAPKEIVKSADKTVRSVAEQVYIIARRYCPVRTGFLRSSIMVRKETFTTRVSISEYNIVAQADYAGYVEFGTRFMMAQPYLRPAARIASVEFAPTMKREVEKFLRSVET